MSTATITSPLKEAAFLLFSLALTSISKRRSIYDKIQRIPEFTSKQVILEAYDAISQAFATYGREHLALAFNGGKDCLIVFQLVKCYLERHPEIRWPLVVYFHREDEFPEVIEFMFSTAKKNYVPILTLTSGFKEGLKELKEQYAIEAILMGQRKTDPYAPSAIFAKTTDGWPDIMRINPILNLNYSGVWQFLKSTNTSYCTLYDNGYTSLGAKSKTLPNKRLSFDEKTSKYRPAHELVVENEQEDERSGRD
jgi:FAD synthetase